MSNPILIQIVTNITYYLVYFLVYSLVFIIEIIDFLNTYPLFVIIPISILIFNTCYHATLEKDVALNTCKDLSVQVYNLMKANEKLQENLILIEYKKKELKIQHLFKKCKQCSQLKTLTDFNSNLNSKDTYTNYCKECSVQY